MTVLSLKKLAQILWQRARSRTTARARQSVILRVTAMACLARSRLPAPSSFDTLVLLQAYSKLVLFNEMNYEKGNQKESHI